MTLDRGWEKTQGVRTAIPLSGGSLQSADARVRIAIPEAGIAQPVTFQLTTLGQPGAVRSHFGFAHTSFMLAALDDHGNPIKPFVYLLPVRMTLMYQDTDIITLKEDQLILYEWNTDSSSWQDAAQSCTPASSYNRDMENHLLSVDVCQGFLFALMSEYQHSVFLPWIKQP